MKPMGLGSQSLAVGGQRRIQYGRVTNAWQLVVCKSGNQLANS